MVSPFNERYRCFSQDNHEVDIAAAPPIAARIRAKQPYPHHSRVPGENVLSPCLYRQMNGLGIEPFEHGRIQGSQGKALAPCSPPAGREGVSPL
ncbi:hypothetical protein HRbin16_01701 [bacterium HR16]|nr:hypothetical protein HRbin16_01701 [bacterium HR16]